MLLIEFGTVSYVYGCFQSQIESLNKESPSYALGKEDYILPYLTAKTMKLGLPIALTSHCWRLSDRSRYSSPRKSRLDPAYFAVAKMELRLSSSPPRLLERSLRQDLKTRKRIG